MIDLVDSKLLDILPVNLRSDPDIIAASKAIDIEFVQTVTAVKNVYTVADIENAGSEIVDHIAIESHVDFYDFNLPIEKRRELAKNALIYHFSKGTPFAVEELINTIFGDGMVQEWWEYGGEPFHFKVLTNNGSASAADVGMFNRAVESVQNKRSRLDGIEITLTDELNLYFAGIVHTGEFLEIRQVV